MADDSFDDDAEIPPGSGSINPAALDAATAGPAASTDEAREFLREQKHLTRLQAKILHEQHALELSHMRWRRFNDQMKGALQIMAVALAIFVVVAIAAAVYSASQADGLVIESFTVPPSFVQAGLSGQVIADALTSRLAAIRRVTVEESFSDTSDVSTDHGDDVRVEIPETGISISEASRYLRNWLGHERHISGSLSDSGHGVLTLTIDVAGAPPVSITGANLDAIETATAEKVFSEIDPVNNVIYLGAKGRLPEAYAAAAKYAQEAPGPAQKSDAYGLWSDSTAWYRGDLALAVERARLGVEADPSIAITHLELAEHLQELGHEEEALKEFRVISRLKARDQAPIRQEYAFNQIRVDAERHAANAVGDYGAEAATACLKFCSAADILMLKSIAQAQSHDSRMALQLARQAEAAGDARAFDMANVRYLIAADLGDWVSALHELDAQIRVFTSPGSFEGSKYAAAVILTQYAPLRAITLAHLGLFAEAHRTIDATPRDCYDCDRVRGTVDALEGKRGAAAFWYARAVAEAPSIPFAYADWGEMLLRRGDYAGAIAQFKRANAKGPHFADPLEMWGEALMLQNRSDLALAKFTDAEKYAPNWGRLHLKRGEALFYAGRRDDAKKQFAIAAGLDLSPSDRAVLDRWMTSHG